MRGYSKTSNKYFYFSIPIKRHQLIFQHYSFTGHKDLLQQWADKMPDLIPYGDRFFSDSGMLSICAKAGPECLIIKTEKLFAPKEEHGKSRMEHVVNCYLKT